MWMDKIKDWIRLSVDDLPNSTQSRTIWERVVLSEAFDQRRQGLGGYGYRKLFTIISPYFK